MHYYQFNISDYRAATAHLSNDEDLAYRRLLDMYYDIEKPIPLDIAWVARRIRIEASIVRDVLNDMFVKQEDGWYHQRCQEVIAEYHAKAEQASRAGKASAERKRNKTTTDVERTFNERTTDVQPTINQELLTNNQLNTCISPPDGEPLAETVKKLPGCDHKSVIALYHQHLPTMRRIEVWNDTRAGYLRQRWREVATELGQEKDIVVQDVLSWWEEFFQHVGKSKFLTGRVNDKGGRAFVADLEWILKPSNFAKIIEGKYHGT